MPEDFEYDDHTPIREQEQHIRDLKRGTIPNATWQAVDQLQLGKKSKKQQMPKCDTCKSKLEFKRLPQAPITSDSRETYYCYQCDIYTLASEYDEDDIELLDGKMLRNLKAGQMVQVCSE